MAGAHRKGPRQPGKHEKPRTCGHTWTKPLSPQFSGQHINHVCGNVPDHRGRHLCNNWECSETD